MITRLSKKVSSIFVKNNIISLEDYDVYCYSFEILFSTIANAFLVAALAIISFRVTHTICYLLGFITLRLVAGGYHAKTHLRCTMVLFFSYSLFIILTYLLTTNIYLIVTIIVSLVSLVLIWILAPIEDENKPLSTNEVKHFRIRSRICALVVTGIAIVSVAFVPETYRIYPMSVSLGALSVALSLAAGYIKFLVGNVASRI